MNCFIIHLPRESFVIHSHSENLVTGLDNGFIFSPFANSDSIFTIPIPKEEAISRSSQHVINNPSRYYPFNYKEPDYLKYDGWIKRNDRHYFAKNKDLDPSTSKEEHSSYVNAAIDKIKEVEKISGQRAKIIVSRVKNISTSQSPSSLFRSLMEKYPEAFVFLFSTPDHGTWIGASPEILVEMSHTFCSSISLAGTKKAISTTNVGNLLLLENHNVSVENIRLEGWDEKNITEQRIVTDFIFNSFIEEGLQPEKGNLHTFRTGPVEHLRTIIKAPLDPERFAEPSKIKSTRKKEERMGGYRRLAIRMLARLSPTPAICGFPRDNALDFINGNELHERNLYGGFIGYYNSDASLISYVNLRSAHLDSDRGRALLYAGGGITSDSSADNEWEETEMKLSTLETIM